MNPLEYAWAILKEYDPPVPAPICRRCTNAYGKQAVRIDECGCTPEGGYQ